MIINLTNVCNKLNKIYQFYFGTFYMISITEFIAGRFYNFAYFGTILKSL